MKLKCVTNSLTDHGLLVLELLSQLIISFLALALLHFIATGAVEMRARFVKRMDWFKFLLTPGRSCGRPWPAYTRIRGTSELYLPRSICL